MVALTDAPHRVTKEAPAQPDQRQLVQSLCRPGILDSGTQPVDVMETHISYVLLAGAYAYKIKKAVNLQFLDFSTLSARRRDCLEELRLNRPLAPSVYLDVVAITGTMEAPAIGGDGPVLEYALKMRQFRQDGLFSAMLQRGEVDHPQAPATLSVITPQGDAYLQHYFDDRGVVRLYRMTFDGALWTLQRDEPDFSELPFHQRFLATVGDDRIDGRWEASPDGEAWELDFTMLHRRV